MRLFQAAFCILFITSTYSVVPPVFKKCNRQDANFHTCHLEAAQKGILLLTKPFKALDLPSLEPLEVSQLSVKGRGGAVAVDQNFKNCKIFGFTEMKIEKFDLELKKGTLDVTGVIPKMEFNCQYNLDGQVLLVPIKGEGDSVITFKNYHSNYSAILTTFTKKGKTHLKVVESHMKTDPDLVHFYFNNLFDGNKELGDNINKVLNENWREIYNDVKPDYDDATGRIITQIITKMYNKISVEELFD